MSNERLLMLSQFYSGTAFSQLVALLLWLTKALLVQAGREKIDEVL